MNPAQIAVLLTQVVSLMNVSLRMAENSQKYRELVAQAVSEDRDLSPEELASLRHDAQTAVDNL